ncbi:MAG TPA: phage minor capsid protein [Pseudonocardiaceae bacterium]|jgi:hypothetical protein|nr:phage minor capsid protein [Pseudonocardiaceae bacterium]
MTAAAQQTPGGRREDTALAVAAAVAAVMVGAQLMLLGQLGEAVRRVLQSANRRKVARELHAAAAATMAGAVTRTDRTLAAAQQRILRETTAVLNDSLPPVRTLFGVPVGQPAKPFAVPDVSVSPGWQQFLVRIHDGAVFAVGEVDDVFRQAADATRGSEPALAAQKIMDDTAAHGLTVLTDTAGRRWPLPVYVQMATRTACTRLALAAQYQLMAGHGMDLVMVDKTSLGQSCPKCLPFEYRVLSLFGSTPAGSMVTAVDSRGVRQLQPVAATVAEAVARGLLHPSCRHFLVPFADGMNMMMPPAASGPSYAGQQRQRALERSVRRETAGRAVALTPLAKAQANRRLTAARSTLDRHVRTYHQAPRQPRKAG